MQTSEQKSIQTQNDLPPVKEIVKEYNSDVRQEASVTFDKLATFDIQSKTKLTKLIDRWSRPIDKYNLKLWIQNSNIKYSKPSLGIGIGTKIKPNIFTFVILDNDSINWLETSIKESIKIFNRNKQSENNSSDTSILWLKKRELDKLRKIGILLLIMEGNNTSIRFMINSKACLFADLNLDDVNWMLETLNMAKFTLDGMLKYG